MRLELNPDWNEFLRLLLSQRVKFLLVGGHAVAGHGEPRFTEDLDVFVDVSAENARALREVLVRFGFGEAAPTEAELQELGRIWMIGRKPMRIDILTEIDGVSFEECWSGRAEAEFSGGVLPLIGREHLLKNKRASGRTKDLADVERLLGGQQRQRRPSTEKRSKSGTPK